MNKSISAKRLRQVREEQDLTQTEFAQKLRIGKTTTEYERGRTKLSGELVMRLLEEFKINPMWLYGESDQKILWPSAKDSSPTIISLDDNHNENIVMVSQKAAAGYAGNIDRPEYYKKLPAFSIPTPEYRNASYRCFQVEGHSMVPTIFPDEWIIAQAVNTISEIKNNKIYVVVQEDSVRIKQVQNDEERSCLILISINKEYDVELVPYDAVKELWCFHSKITRELSTENSDVDLSAIYKEIQLLKNMMVKNK